MAHQSLNVTSEHFHIFSRNNHQLSSVKLHPNGTFILSFLIHLSFTRSLITLSLIVNLLQHYHKHVMFIMSFQMLIYGFVCWCLYIMYMFINLLVLSLSSSRTSCPIVWYNVICCDTMNINIWWILEQKRDDFNGFERKIDMDSLNLLELYGVVLETREYFSFIIPNHCILSLNGEINLCNCLIMRPIQRYNELISEIICPVKNLYVYVSRLWNCNATENKKLSSSPFCSIGLWEALSGCMHLCNVFPIKSVVIIAADKIYSKKFWIAVLGFY